MTIAFECPACKATRNAPAAMAGRRVRCPECDELVEVVPLPFDPEGDSAELEPADLESAELEPLDSPEGGRAPGRRDARMAAEPTEPLSGDTVMLEAVDVIPTPLPGPRPAPAPAPAEDAPPQLKKSQLVETEMDMTPMVDATFQLLIFFMITAAFALQKSKEIPKPKSDEASTNVVQQEEEETANAVIVRIDEYSSYLVINADGDPEEAPTVVDLHIKLRRAHDGDSEGRVPTKLRVEVHDEAIHERVIAAIDAGNDVGFAEVELTSLAEDV